MVSLTIATCIKVFLLYSLVTIILPAIVFGDKLRGKSFAIRFISYFTAGNFYIITIVYLLGVLHILCKPTLIIFTIVPAFFIYMFIHRQSSKQFASDTYTTTERLAKGTYGFKTWILRFIKNLFRLIWQGIKNTGILIGKNAPEFVLILGLIFTCWWVYGSNVLDVYGYTSSDMVVHNYWINGLDNNQIFISGVYPFGFHNIIYYLHQMFNIETYEVLRVFSVVQLIYLVLAFACMLRYITKSKYIPYLGAFFFVALNIFDPYIVRRYFSALPQEYGMIFIPIGIVFALEFFKLKKQELLDLKKEESDDSQEIEKKPRLKIKDRVKNYFKGLDIREMLPSTYVLFFLAINFSITFSAHCFVTIILGVIYIAMALGFCAYFFRKQYCFRLIGSCILGIVIAVIPLALALLFGGKLHGSFGWGMKIMAGSDSTQNGGGYSAEELYNKRLEILGLTSDDLAKMYEAQEPEAKMVDGEVVYIKPAINLDELEEKYISEGKITKEDVDKVMNESKEVAYDQTDVEETESEGIGSKILQFFADLKDGANTFLGELTTYYGAEYVYPFIICILLTGLLGFAFIIASDYQRGFTYLTFFIAAVFFDILANAETFGVIRFMEANRWHNFMQFLLFIYPVLVVDGILCLIIGLWENKGMNVLMNVMSAIIVAFGCYFSISNGLIKDYGFNKQYQTNGAITTITNILRDMPDRSWTIVSAVDETRLTAEHGYHYEVSEFLRDQEYYYTGYVSDEKLTKDKGVEVISIPTQYVFFFIEKIPIDYTDEGYAGSGSQISAASAANPLCESQGSLIYKDGNRNITMSRMYEWAKAYEKIYPNEFKVYYEDDEFICYMIEQNTYALFNYAIDYGYNYVDYPEYHDN